MWARRTPVPCIRKCFDGPLGKGTALHGTGGLSDGLCAKGIYRTDFCDGYLYAADGIWGWRWGYGAAGVAAGFVAGFAEPDDVTGPLPPLYMTSL